MSFIRENEAQGVNLKSIITAKLLKIVIYQTETI